MAEPYKRKVIIGKTERMGKNPLVRIVLAIFIILGLLRVIKTYPIMIPIVLVFAVVFYFRSKKRKEMIAAGMPVSTGYYQPKNKPEEEADEEETEDFEAAEIEASDSEPSEEEAEANAESEN